DHLCKGTTGACVGGAIKQMAGMDTWTRGTEIYASQLNKNFTKEFVLPNLMGSRVGNYDIVNFRRGLASNHLDFESYAPADEANFADTNYNKAFDPTLMERYAANMTPDGQPIIDITNTGSTPAVSYGAYILKTTEKGYKATPYAADPFLGTNQRVNPFYTFYCLDRAHEIKARIRIVVRDWDKVFTSTSPELELISDVYKTPISRRQDLPSADEEIGGDPGMYNLYNDVDDWDVLTAMTRTDPSAVGIYDPGNTYWLPTPTLAYPLGFWNPTIFPNQGPPSAAAE
nr:hypothetical protein [Bdellovibrionales bacterium]